ncbi:hypothetical protein [Lactovum odontotermitis]
MIEKTAIKPAEPGRLFACDEHISLRYTFFRLLGKKLRRNMKSFLLRLHYKNKRKIVQAFMQNY